MSYKSFIKQISIYKIIYHGLQNYFIFLNYLYEFIKHL